MSSEWASSMSMNGTEPVADASSKTVMIAGERGDDVKVEAVVERFGVDTLPDQLSIIRRVSRFYGPELILASEDEANYILNAPGPASHLRLWRVETSTSSIKEGYMPVADIKAVLLDGEYETCSVCGDLIKTIEHERLSALGECND